MQTIDTVTETRDAALTEALTQWRELLGGQRFMLEQQFRPPHQLSVTRGQKSRRGFECFVEKALHGDVNRTSRVL